MPNSTEYSDCATALRYSLDRKTTNYKHLTLTQLISTVKRDLNKKIEYEEVKNDNLSVHRSLKSKYVVLKKPTTITTSTTTNATNSNSNNNTVTIAIKKNNVTLNGQNATANKVQLPKPKKILFPRENIQIGWKNSSRKWDIGSGMCNIGNSCYLNATLQALFHVPAFANWLISDDVHQEKCPDQCGSQDGCIICAMAKTLRRTQSSTGSISPDLINSRLRQICKRLMPGRQEDAHEFLRYLMESMENAYLKRFRDHTEYDHSTKETAPIHQIFGGYLRTSVQCLKCRHVSETFQHFQELSLDIREVKSLEEAIGGYFACERIEDGAYTCESCKKNVNATTKFSIERAPIVLCIQLKRFSAESVKINRTILLSEKLDMSPYYVNQLTGGNREQEAHKYHLISVVEHIGYSQSTGHYTSIALTSMGKYFKFDDSHVTQMSKAEVLNTKGYLLFYELESLSPNKLSSSTILTTSTPLYSSSLSTTTTTTTELLTTLSSPVPLTFATDEKISVPSTLPSTVITTTITTATATITTVTTAAATTTTTTTATTTASTTIFTKPSTSIITNNHQKFKTVPSNIRTWNNKPSELNKNVNENKRKFNDSHSDMEQTKRKKLKTHNRYANNRDNPGYNPFNEHQRKSNKNNFNHNYKTGSQYRSYFHQYLFKRSIFNGVRPLENSMFRIRPNMEYFPIDK